MCKSKPLHSCFSVFLVNIYLLDTLAVLLFYFVPVICSLIHWLEFFSQESAGICVLLACHGGQFWIFSGGLIRCIFKMIVYGKNYSCRKVVFFLRMLYTSLVLYHVFVNFTLLWFYRFQSAVTQNSDRERNSWELPADLLWFRHKLMSCYICKFISHAISFKYCIIQTVSLDQW